MARLRREAMARGRVPVRKATDPTHFTAELGPLPVGLERPHLQTPIRLNDFLHPAEDDVGDGEDRLAPRH
ncbi:hypothetical protein [Streptomyces sp. WM6378]|uniref:hypothetical protein n=1 Tax=Streptomyces sp. WM6378 TaxID=1415557 RepID=UPI00131EB87A|nr:hypothetical protein [Streptomyces sp. WM6378]